MKLKYFSHSAFQITTDDGKVIIIDPFLDNNPTSPVKSDSVNADYIILSHAHGDHLGDTVKIGKRCNSTVICVNELANYLIAQGLKAHNMSIGGGFDFEFGRVKFTIAHHGSKTPDDQYAGEPAGIIIISGGKTIYYTGDTGLFYDMKLIGELFKIDYMLLPIGDNYTMGIRDAVKAVEFVNPAIAIPLHYNTFPVIQANPQEFKQKLEALNRKCKVMEYGEEMEL
jgi:L-ascorbate metabolism protein UlaG (beta-lactamase superfamily)